jgi:hypothetical protein
MFVGHYCAAFAAKRVAPNIPLPVYFIACQTIDLFWAAFVLLGIEKVRFVAHITASNSLDLYFMPFTHSLPAALGWAAGIAALYWCLAPSTPQRVRITLLFAAVVLSHWILDFIAHIPDLPLWYDSYKVGLGLWNYRIFEFALELALLWGSIALVMKMEDQNPQRLIILGIIMSGFQIACFVLPTPGQDYMIASHLLASYVCLTVFSYFADGKRMPNALPAAN